MEDLDAVEYESCTPPDVAETAKKVTLELLPSKSRKIYEKRYDEFIKWCNSNRINKYSENVLLTYFSKQAETYKAPSLWSLFSMLMATLLAKNDINIGTYSKLIAFLKRKRVGYQPKKSKILSFEQIIHFLSQAPDEQFLMIKVALIFGICGACRRQEVIIRDMQNPLERYTNTELLQRFRFSRQTIEMVLLPLIYPNGNAPDDMRGLPILPIIKLCTALRFYAVGSLQRPCGDLHSISQSSACRIIREVSEIIARNLGQYIKFPDNPHDMTRNREMFYAMAGFPGVVGCVDGTHIEIKNPGGPTAEVYRNRKSWMSLNVQAVAGPQAEFLDIVIRWSGSAHDARIFRSSSVALKFEQRQLEGILLGDSAYAQLSYFFTPMNNPLTRAERRYNVAQKSTRNVVERAFGQWKQRFRCLSKCLNYNVRAVTRIVAATAVLHNIAVKGREQFAPDPHFLERNVPVPPATRPMRCKYLPHPVSIFIIVLLAPLICIINK
ncbi:hypothetical protein PPYR_01451 [Photinus pyralis]|uniref:DDE Tnp4 domain-containing protein n=1 Tax=Photinus pyralis TaxID=7054 RepID=A0A5N4B4D9_PHOPY|nr:hypothetical protein PPYR_01451 [Photinus pyralis]